MIELFVFKLKSLLLVTAFARVRDGKEPVKPNSELSYASNFLYIC